MCLSAGTFMRERDGIGVEDLPSEPARVHKPGVLRRARERICSAQGRIGVCFVMVVLALFILWPLSLALTAAAQGPLHVLGLQHGREARQLLGGGAADHGRLVPTAVSYTHLTLPTKA